MCVALSLQVVNYSYKTHKEPTAKGIHNDVRLKCILLHFEHSFPFLLLLCGYELTCPSLGAERVSY